MFNNSVIHTVLILLSASTIIFSIPVRDDRSTELLSTSTINHTSPAPEDFTTELQNVLVCETTDQQAECAAFLEARLNKDSEEYRQLQYLKEYSSFLLPIPVKAAILGFTELIQALLRNGLPINKKYNISLEETMLHLAAEQGQDNLITLLLIEGADIEVKNNHGNTPLHEAASQLKTTTAKLLLDAGANVNVTNNMGETPLFQVVKNLSPQEYTYYVILREVVAEYINMNYPTAKNIIKLVLEHGADTNIANNVGKTPLHVASQYCNSTIVKLLIDGGANIDVTDFINQTPLHKAAESNNLSVVEYLITMGADKTITDLNNKTALDIATEKNFTEIVDLLSRKTFYHVVSL